MKSIKIRQSNIDLIKGSCLEALSNAKKTIDLVAVDPPYGTTQNKWDIVIPFEPMWEMIKRVL